MVSNAGGENEFMICEKTKAQPLPSSQMVAKEMAYVHSLYVVQLVLVDVCFNFGDPQTKMVGDNPEKRFFQLVPV